MYNWFKIQEFYLLAMREKAESGEQLTTNLWNKREAYKAQIVWELLVDNSNNKKFFSA